MVYEKLTTGTGITLSNLCKTPNQASQIICSLPDTLAQKVSGRTPFDLSHLKVVIIDEADEYFKEQDRQSKIGTIAKSKDI
mmetsp:Transcript_7766/g.13034  ORF Transcript_7766/g.13034 Transcript_7766/m.13034 type:complete len:81 (-) Transcript_7766:838-1080(-)